MALPRCGRGERGDVGLTGVPSTSANRDYRLGQRMADAVRSLIRPVRFRPGRLAVIVNDRPSLRVRIPVTDQPPTMAPRTPAASTVAPWPDGQFVDEARDQATWDVEGDRPAIEIHVVGRERSVAHRAPANAQAIEKVAKCLAPGVSDDVPKPPLVVDVATTPVAS